MGAGDLGAVAASVDAAWVQDFKSAAAKLSSSSETKANLQSVLSGLDALKTSAKHNNATDAKTSFVSLVDSLQSWVASAGCPASCAASEQCPGSATRDRDLRCRYQFAGQK